MIEKSFFPDSLTQADMKPVYKKDSRNEKENYSLVCIFPNLSKICGCCMHTPVKKYFSPIPSKYQFGFKKGYSA